MVGWGGVFGSKSYFEQGRSGKVLTIGKLTQLYPSVGSAATASALLLCLQGVHRPGAQEHGLVSLGVSP